MVRSSIGYIRKSARLNLIPREHFLEILKHLHELDTTGYLDLALEELSASTG